MIKSRCMVIANIIRKLFIQESWNHIIDYCEEDSRRSSDQLRSWHRHRRRKLIGTGIVIQLALSSCGVFVSLSLHYYSAGRCD